MCSMVGFGLSAQERDSTIIPKWFQESINEMVGEWKTSNAKYHGENDPYEAFGMRWEHGIDGKSMKGELYGFYRGKETGPFWEFRTYWHPADRKVYALQFGYDGVFGEGEMLPGKIDQTFFNPNGTFFRVGHASQTTEDTHVTTSFDINDKGERTARRSYTWTRVK